MSGPGHSYPAWTGPDGRLIYGSRPVEPDWVNGADEPCDACGGIGYQLADFAQEMVGIHLRHGPYADEPLHDLEWSTLALCGEAGELANEVKKIHRDHDGDLEPRREAAIRELGDVLVYVAVVAECLDISLQNVMERAASAATEWDARRTAHIRPDSELLPLEQAAAEAGDLEIEWDNDHGSMDVDHGTAAMRRRGPTDRHWWKFDRDQPEESPERVFCAACGVRNYDTAPSACSGSWFIQGVPTPE